VAVQWPEGFRLDPNARWDDEIKRLIEALSSAAWSVQLSLPQHDSLDDSCR
jgi:hypothetical protein